MSSTLPQSSEGKEKEEKWVWERGLTTDFPDKLTHSYDPELVEPAENAGSIAAYLLLTALIVSFIIHSLVIAYQGRKCSSMSKKSDKIVGRWLKISFSLGKAIVLKQPAMFVYIVAHKQDI